ncbi:radical SAM protein [Lagierella sp.]|uniref:radical SAM protein n=1 Tax=Lagierella sp. TaxID=2849657 RepID=UPI00260F672A|nr:radical SAM protein [Lagierella sp.]
MKAFEINNKKIVFNSNNYEFYELNSEIDDVEDSQISSLKSFKLPEHVLSKVILNISNICNLNCEYCYANGGNYNRKNAIMSKGSINKIIRRLQEKNVSEIIQLKFFGGEPLLNKECILYALKKFSTNFEINEFLIVTNGLLLDEIFLDSLKGYNIFFSLSLDVPERIHNQLRGKGTFEKVLAAINLLRNKGYNNKLKLISTYTNKQYEQGITIEKCEKLLLNIHKIYHINRVHTGEDSDLYIRNYGIKNRKKEIELTFDNILGLKKGKYINPTVDRVLRSLIFGLKNDGFCDELTSNVQLSYDYNGDEYKCNRFWGMSKYSTDNDGFLLEIEKINNKEHYELCKNCWCRNLCMICTASKEQDFIHEKYGFNSSECLNQELFEYTIRKLIEYTLEGKNEKLFKNYYEMISNFPE